MDYTPVSSSTISAVAFDPDTMTLGVAFQNGTEYHYFNVPAHVFEGLKSAGSPGQYFDAFVKKAGYSYARIR